LLWLTISRLAQRFVILISIKALAVAFGFIQSSIPVTGSFWNGYGGRVVRVPATLVF
jgi:hypothetical protein